MTTLNPPLLALANATGPVFFLDESHLVHGCQAAAQSPRKRIILPIHRSESDPVQRLVNFVQPGTYIAPHHHPAAGFSETILVLAGKILFLEFSPTGEVLHQRLLAANSLCNLVDFTGTCLHTFICLEENTVLLEIKKGPYVAATDKVFAPWAPTEGSPEALLYLDKLLKSC